MSAVREYLRLRAVVLQHLGSAKGLEAQRRMDALYPKLTAEEIREVGKGCRVQDRAKGAS